MRNARTTNLRTLGGPSDGIQREIERREVNLKRELVDTPNPTESDLKRHVDRRHRVDVHAEERSRRVDNLRQSFKPGDESAGLPLRM